MRAKPAAIRHTQQRRSILAVVKLSSKPLTAEAVARLLRRRTRLSVSTLYRNLDVLAGRGEIVRVIGPDGVSRYSGTAQPVLYFQCIQCHTMEVQSGIALAVFVQKYLKRQAPLSVTAFVQGRCATCQSRPR